jgi:putative addiction module component (TIGR02574 family)
VSLAIQPVIANLTPAEKLQLVGELWDQLASSSLELALTPAQQAQLHAEREAIRRNPREGSPWADVKARILSRP